MRFKTKEAKQRFIKLALEKGVKAAKVEFIKQYELPLFVEPGEKINLSGIELTLEELKAIKPNIKVY